MSEETSLEALSLRDLSARLDEYALSEFVEIYVQTRGLLAERQEQPTAPDITPYHDEQTFWQDVINQGMGYETQPVVLEDFAVMDWIPLSPGQYFTGRAEWSRQEAMNFLRYDREGQGYFLADGKRMMIDGGMGCLRLGAKEVGGERLHFLAATSSGVAHRGVLLGVPDQVYRSIAPLLNQRQSISGTLHGEIRYLSFSDGAPVYGPFGHPRRYVYVTGIDDPTAVTRGRLRVSAAITFEVDEQASQALTGERQVPPGVYFSYANFNPTSSKSIDATVKWLDDYATETYLGSILTDFDDVTARLEAEFPISVLMDQRQDPQSISRSVEKAFAHHLDRYTIERIVHGDVITVGNIVNSQNIAIGRDASVTTPPDPADDEPGSPGID